MDESKEIELVVVDNNFDFSKVDKTENKVYLKQETYSMLEAKAQAEKKSFEEVFNEALKLTVEYAKNKYKK